MYINALVQVYIDVLSEGDLQFVASTLYPDIERNLLNAMISFNSRVCFNPFDCICLSYTLSFNVSKQMEVLVRRECGDTLWEFNLRDILRWCQLLKDSQVKL